MPKRSKKLKIYDPVRDEYRDATQRDIDLMQSIVSAYAFIVSSVRDAVGKVGEARTGEPAKVWPHYTPLEESTVAQISAEELH